MEKLLKREVVLANTVYQHTHFLPSLARIFILLWLCITMLWQTQSTFVMTNYPLITVHPWQYSLSICDPPISQGPKWQRLKNPAHEVGKPQLKRRKNYSTAISLGRWPHTWMRFIGDFPKGKTIGTELLGWKVRAACGNPGSTFGYIPLHGTHREAFDWNLVPQANSKGHLSLLKLCDQPKQRSRIIRTFLTCTFPPKRSNLVLLQIYT